jgi:hypothetical protein
MQGTYGTGSGVLPSYTFPMGINAYDPSLGGNPSTFTGWCVAENDEYGNSDPCYVANGIAWYGLCEPGISAAGYNQTSTSPPNIPSEEWFHLNGVKLKPGQYLDVADTTPWETTKGHMAMVLPCDIHGTPLVRLYQGIIDGGVFTMEAPPVQYLQQLSDPKNGICVYHFDVGANNKANAFGVTDFALVNVSNKEVEFTERNTSTFSIAEGFLNPNS